jgi:ABC-type nitrate/sulfonate/bicarbonate transport system substrate-binding protein/outer membrane protein OmpA-like peptidoglycan-associated protein
MKKLHLIPIILLIAAISLLPGQGDRQDPLTPRPLTQVISASLRPVGGGVLKVPLITWGGDVATILAHENGFFKNEGLDTQLFVENNFPKQVEMCLSGQTPLLRGTMGMINAAAELFKKRGTDLTVVYQMTWSSGGDALVTRSHIKKPKDLKGKTIALQLYGPHMDYLANILQSSGISSRDVKLRWFSELSLPSFDAKGRIVDPVSAFLADPGIDAVMCIIPDALNLSSGGREGTGAAGSVKGARIMLSTKTASRIIADVYAVRSDYLSKNRTSIKGFVDALIKAQKDIDGLAKAQRQALLSKAARWLFDSAEAVPDVEGLLGDCTFVGEAGNQQFFSGVGTTRSFKNLNNEIQGNFLQMGLISAKTPIEAADWLGGTAATPIPVDTKPLFDTKKIEQKISVEPTSWAEEGTLFQVEITFAPNQSDFPIEQYAGDFKKALDISQTYGGALIMIEGHSDPLGILQAREKGRASIEIQQMEQQAKNLSLQRAQEVRKSFLSYCRKERITLDESQFVAVGLGISSPKFNPPRTKDEWAANRRVLFRIKQIEAELDEFKPLKNSR